MKQDLIKKIMEEYKKKLTDMDASNIATYASIVSYIDSEELSEDYIDYLLDRANTLDYLYDAFLDIKKGLRGYELVRYCLALDQIAFLDSLDFDEAETNFQC